MLSTQKSKKTALLKYGLLLPVFAALSIGTPAYISKKALPLTKPISHAIETKLDAVLPSVSSAKTPEIPKLKADVTPKSSPDSTKKNKPDMSKAMIFVDNVEVSSYDKIDPANIKSMEVLRGEAALKYGEKGKYGVILIETKKIVEIFNENLKETQTEEVFMQVENPAEFPGGVRELMKFIEHSVSGGGSQSKCNRKGVFTIYNWQKRPC
jgi:hypothetical protein